MKAIVTVVGEDHVGIIAAVCNKLATRNVNVQDISQTILANTFTMIMLVDTEKSNAPFAQLQEDLCELGNEMGLSIHIQREEIFDAMHTI